MFKYLAFGRQKKRQSLGMRKAFQFFPVSSTQRRGMPQNHQRTIIRQHQFNMPQMAFFIVDNPRSE